MRRSNYFETFLHVLRSSGVHCQIGMLVPLELLYHSEDSIIAYGLLLIINLSYIELSAILI